MKSPAGYYAAAEYGNPAVKAVFPFKCILGECSPEQRTVTGADKKRIFRAAPGHAAESGMSPKWPVKHKKFNKSGKRT